METGIFYNYSKTIPSPKELHTKKELEMLQWDSCNCSSKSPAIQLNALFKNELKEEISCQKKYLNFEDREAYTIHFDKKGRLLTPENQLLNGTWIYALLADHQLLAAPLGTISNHSHLTSGLPILNAGFLYVYGGFLINVSNNSGHYKPSLDNIKHSVDWFIKNTKNPELLIEDHTYINDAQVGLRFFKGSELANEISCNPLAIEQTQQIIKESIERYFSTLEEMSKKNQQADNFVVTIPLDVGDHNLDSSDTYYTYPSTDIQDEEKALSYEAQLLRQYTWGNFLKSRYPCRPASRSKA